MISYPIQITALHSLDIDKNYGFREHIQVKHQFYCVLEGIVHYTVENQDYVIRAGEAVITAAGLKRRPESGGEKGKTLVVGFVSPWPELGRPHGLHVKLAPTVVADAHQLVQGDFYPEEHVAVILFHRMLLAILGESWFRRLGQGAESREAQMKAEGESLVQQIEVIMRANVEQPLQLKDFVEISGVSSAHLRRLFQRHRGVPPCTRFRHMRLEQAHRLLQTAQASVIEVAFDLGFSSSQHLAMAFRKHFGYTPSEAVKHPQYDQVEFTSESV